MADPTTDAPSRLRLYRVEDVMTEVGVGHIRARSKADAIEKALRGEVEFFYDGGADIRRGDGLHAYVERGESR